jgi:pimeloyl-ACP methyl ester carboxylesterase
VRHALFSDDVDDELVRSYMRRFQDESALVVLDLLGLDLPTSLRTLDIPVLVLGAEKDSFIYPGALHATADTYGTTAEVFPGMAHAMMLDHGWEKVATRVADWLETTLDAVQRL